MKIYRSIVNEAVASSSPTERAKASEGGKENEVFFDFAIARVVNEAVASSPPTEPRLRGEGKDENEVLIAFAIARVSKF